MAKCEISGKRVRFGNNVSHANNRNKRQFRANIQKVRIVDENGKVRRAYVSTSELRNGAVKKAAPRKILRQMQAEEM